jgi:hypothetical protein
VAVAPGDKVAADDVSEVLFVRATPIELAWVCPQLAARDRYLCDARITVTLRALTDRAELEALYEQVMGSRRAIDIDDVQRYLHSHVEQALRKVVAEHETAALIEGEASASAARAVAEALQAPCFSGGLAIAAAPAVTVTSPAYQRLREAEQRAARALDEHAAQSELRDALARAQRTHLDHLEGMLERLHQLAESSPTVELSELMRSFEESQRGQLYQALISARARRRVTQWLAIVAGHEVLFVDAHEPGEIARRVHLDGPAGPLRALQYDDGSGLLTVGASRGVYLLHPEAGQPDCVLLAADDRAVRGGFNAVAVLADNVVATHSELGVIHWLRTEDGAGRAILADVVQGADTVRAAQFNAGRFWCTVDAQAVTVPADDLAAAPRVITAGSTTLSALCANDATLYAGTSEGEIFIWPDVLENVQPQCIHRGSRRPAESVALVAAGGISRLFYTDTSLAVYCRVLGDTFACRYEAGGQTIRRAECAADVVAATTDARDRVLLWKTDQPQHPASVVSILRLTGHSVQDVCLVPSRGPIA